MGRRVGGIVGRWHRGSRDDGGRGTGRSGAGWIVIIFDSTDQPAVATGWLAVVNTSEGVELKKKIFPRPNASIDNDTIVRPKYFWHRFVKQTTLLRRNDIMNLLFIDMTHDNGLWRRSAVC